MDRTPLTTSGNLVWKQRELPRGRTALITAHAERATAFFSATLHRSPDARFQLEGARHRHPDPAGMDVLGRDGRAPGQVKGSRSSIQKGKFLS
jgi:hypothetical protein